MDHPSIVLVEGNDGAFHQPHYSESGGRAGGIERSEPEQVTQLYEDLPAGVQIGA
jgi:hypothetical protein